MTEKTTIENTAKTTRPVSGDIRQKRMTKDQLWKKIIEEAKKLMEDERLFVYLEEKKTVINLSVRIIYDELKMPKRWLNDEAKKHYLAVWEQYWELEREAELYHKGINNNIAELTTAYEELKGIYRKRRGLIKNFDKNLKKRQSAMKKELKAYREANSKTYKERKNHRAEMRKAVLESRFADADEKAIKEWARDEFYIKNVTILDQSNEHRAVLFAEVEYIKGNKYEYKSGHWDVKGLTLAGIDDNQEAWQVQVPFDDYYGETEISDVEDMDVEDAMARIFCVDERAIYGSLRQGDILAYPLKEGENYSNIWDEDKFSSAVESVDEISIEISEPELKKDWEVLPNHKLMGESTVKCIEATTTGGWHNIYEVNLKDKATMEHTSHAPIVLNAGRWLIVPYPSVYDVD